MANVFRRVILGCGLRDHYESLDTSTLKRKRRMLWLPTFFYVLVITGTYMALDHYRGLGENAWNMYFLSLLAMYPALQADINRKSRIIKATLRERGE